MKKLAFMFAAVVAVSFASCGNKTEQGCCADSDTVCVDEMECCETADTCCGDTAEVEVVEAAPEAE